ncbi:MAG: flavin reductase family protein [Kiloniellales bacterium]|nr:flavin reductase family protein [Kiloniellales bacterium]
MTDSAFNPLDLRRAFGTFATGVTVVTTRDTSGRPLGFTANSFTSVSLEPPLVLVCLARSAGCYDVFVNAKNYAVNILAEDQRETSARFAARGFEKFEGVEWRKATTGAPILPETSAWLDCETFQIIEAGDHAILVGRVIDYGYNARPPLGYCRGAYVTFGLSEEVLRVAEMAGTLKVGALVEFDQKFLLKADSSSGTLALPLAESFGPPNDPDSLLGQLAKSGIEAQVPFLFSAFSEGEKHFVYYRGEARPLDRDAAAGKRQLSLAPFRFYELDALPWHLIEDKATRAMIRRYIQERDADSFGVYIGDEESGTVSPLN